MARKIGAVVARLAFLCSDVVVDCQPNASLSSLFAEELQSLLLRNSQGPPVVSIPYTADAGQAAGHHRCRNPEGLLSLTGVSSSRTIAQLLPTLSEQFLTVPVVLHLAVKGDLSDVLVLRSAVPFFLHSTTVLQAHDNALVASKLATSEKKAVVHVFQEDVADERFEEMAEEEVKGFLNEMLPSSSAISTDFLSNGHADGPGNGNGHGDANSIDYAIDSSNGDTNGIKARSLSSSGTVSEISEPASPPPAPLDDQALTSLFQAYEAAALSAVALVKRAVRPSNHIGPSDAHTVVFTLGQPPKLHLEGVAWVQVSLLSPLLPSKILRYIRPSVRRIIVLEQLYSWNLKWTPLYLDVIAAVQLLDEASRPSVQSGTLGDPTSITQIDALKFIQNIPAVPLREKLRLGKITTATNASLPESIPSIPKHETSYTKILSQLFADRLDISNTPELAKSLGAIATTPEFALGRVMKQLDGRKELIRLVDRLVLEPDGIPAELHAMLSKWLMVSADSVKSTEIGAEIIRCLEVHTSTENSHMQSILPLKSYFLSKSRWIIGSDAWAYDLGSSGLHHLIASGLNVNTLIIDTVPYSYRNKADPTRRKRDIGLYAMNHGDVYVASVAVFSSYTQVLQALVEADRFNGPSVVLAYLPYLSEETPALDVLKETKLAVDAGYWPLYRWDPSKERLGKEPFALDSDSIKRELKDFVDRQNHLSQLTRSQPELAVEIVSSLGESVQTARRQRARQAYDELVNNISGAPLLILFASDGGTAEKKAKRLANRGKARGLVTTVTTMDSMSIEDVAKEEYVVFITSVAGQGEAPQNGRTFFKALNAAVARGDKPFSLMKFAVFGMGDSHYWPRAEDAQYCNKAGKDLDSRLEALGGVRFVSLGLGDAQDADGPETGYKLWEPLVWKALGVDSIEVKEIEPEPITLEHMKIASNYVRGTIVEGLADTSTGGIAPSDGQVSKFHGVYLQDDRDVREERQAQGVEPAYGFMIRVRMPGGVCTPQQWLAMDRIADEYGNGTIKITTRQTFQFHGIVKRHVKSTIQSINRVLLDTLAACGDAVRNVLCSAIPTKSRLHEQVYAFCKELSERLLPRMSAYHEIWLDKKLVAGEAVHDFEPLYGAFYLPRKFKIAVAVPPTNDVDVFAHDVGFIAIVDGEGNLDGFNVTAGGGMGVTHGNRKTYPRLGSMLGYCTAKQGHDVAEKIMLVQRDNGNRTDRKNGRMQYTIDRMGLDVFKREVEKLLGWSLAPPRPYTFDRNIDDFGWAEGGNGKYNFMMFIENGRVQDAPALEFKTALREIAKVHKGTFRTTANQHLMLADVAPEDLAMIKGLLVRYKLDNLNHSGLRLSSSACVAFPTCGQAMAESERYLPILISKVETICEEYGLRNDSIVMRMTGCPNGCTRPYLAEVAFVGKAPGTYLMLLGGGYHGQRLNKIFRESVTEPEILAILKPMIKHYALERQEGEHFGDFVVRAGYILPTTSGKEWYDGMGGLGRYREVSVG